MLRESCGGRNGSFELYCFSKFDVSQSLSIPVLGITLVPISAESDFKAVW